MNVPVNLVRYGLVFIGSGIAIAIALEALLYLTGIDMNSSATGMLPVMMAAMIEGQKRAQSGADPFTSGEAWRAAIWMTLVGAVISFTMVLLLMLLPFWSDVFSSIPFNVWVVIFLGVSVLMLLVNRFFLTMGYKNQRKVMEKKAQE